MMLEEKHSSLILRIGLGMSFLFLGVNKIAKPEIWVGWIPLQLKPLIPDVNQFLVFNGVMEVVAAFMLIFGIYTKVASVAVSAFLLAILLFFGADDITSRDIGLLAMAITIVVLGPGELSVDEKYLRRRA